MQRQAGSGCQVAAPCHGCGGWPCCEGPTVWREGVCHTPCPCPCPAAEEHITLGAELDDGNLIVGQNQISHPSASGGCACRSLAALLSQLSWPHLLTRTVCPPAVGSLLMGFACSSLPHTQPLNLAHTAPQSHTPSLQARRRVKLTSRAARRCLRPSNASSTCRQVGTPRVPVWSSLRGSRALGHSLACCRCESPASRHLHTCLAARLPAEGDTHEHEVAPAPNPRVLSELQRSDAVLYGMGSLYTSIIPSLILKGVGECIAATPVPKVRRRGRRRASADRCSPLLPSGAAAATLCPRHCHRLRAAEPSCHQIILGLSPSTAAPVADLPPQRRPGQGDLLLPLPRRAHDRGRHGAGDGRWAGWLGWAGLGGLGNAG